MQLNHIKYQYHNVTYSSETVSSTLNDVYVTQDPLIWTPTSGTTSEWLKVNLYYSTLISRIDITYSGTCSSLKIEGSLDNFNWETISDTFVPGSTELSIDYSDDTYRFIFFKLIVNSPVSFIVEDLDIYSDVIWRNDDIISHNYLRSYGINFRDNYPVLPSLVMDMFKMMENYNNLDSMLFDSTLYSSTAVSCSNPTSSSGQLSVSGLTLDSSVQYLWDYDDPLVIYGEDTNGDTTASTSTMSTDLDLSDYSVDEFQNKYLVITSGSNMGSYQITANTNLSSSNTITISGTFAYTLSNMSFKVQDLDEDVLLENPNIIISADPTINPDDHEYSVTGTYYPRLLLIGDGYNLEFVTSTSITV